MLRQFRREPVRAMEIAERALRLCEEYRFEYYSMVGSLIRAWALVVQGEVEEGGAAYAVALSQFRGTGALLRMPHYLCLLADMQRGSSPVVGLRTIEEGAETAQKTQERWCDAELERTRGELRQIQSRQAATEAHEAFQRSIRIATRQGARIYELRARMSDARLWRSLGQPKKALEVLNAMHDRLFEGRGTTDVRQAEALMSELRESVREYQS
jgi:predicted ATPase